MSDQAVIELRDKFPGETCWIVGKGPSLKHLRAKHFGIGPVITINEAILIVQDLGLTNPLFSMQKDGLEVIMVRPREEVTLILQSDLSDHWFEDHPLRLLVDPVKEMGFAEKTVMSIRMCVALARIMGCSQISFVCCDSLSTADMRTYDVHTGESSLNIFTGHYAYVVSEVLEEVKDIPHGFIVPSGAA